jgi:hypothetical protein
MSGGLHRLANGWLWSVAVCGREIAYWTLQAAPAISRLLAPRRHWRSCSHRHQWSMLLAETGY